jgi:hypothetical protein
MMAKRRTKASLWVYLAPAAAIVVLVLARVLFTGPRDGLSTAVRGLALAGYGLLFLSIFSAGYLRELVRRFGRPFVTLHHLMSLSGLALVTAHFVAVAGRGAPVRVRAAANAGLAFLANGGRIALALIIVAALAAWARSRFKSAWRAVHFSIIWPSGWPRRMPIYWGRIRRSGDPHRHPAHGRRGGLGGRAPGACRLGSPSISKMWVSLAAGRRAGSPISACPANCWAET